jgi:SPP1 family predicted phage head-tail adaptor
MIRAQDLSERISIQSQNRLPDGAGGFAESWQTLAIVWAEVRAASATHGTRFGGTTTRRFVKIFIRDRADLSWPHRVLWEGRVLDVLAIRQAGPDRVELECEEILQ